MALPKTEKEVTTALQMLERQLAIDAAVEALGLEQWWRNGYLCDHCGIDWSDDWTAQCDDRCPRCDTSNSPYTSVPITGKGGDVMILPANSED